MSIKTTLRVFVPLFALLGAVGCAKSPASAPMTPVTTSKAAAPTTPLTDAQLAQAKVNESGVVPILEYHNIRPEKTAYDRTIAHFRADLERLYREGYRPVLLSEYLDNRIATPLGTSPVILTFDDAVPTQFHYLPDGSLDPDCAIGILQEFAKQHPDFPVKATFFVLPNSAFGQPKWAAKKMQALLAMGCEIGNHTVTHRALSHLSDIQVQQELADCVTLIHKLAPQAKVDTIALPFGLAPHNRALLARGEFHGETYANRAVLLVGAEPAPSPVSPKFKPMHLPRIQAVEGIDGSTFWLDYLKRHPERRYVSDGDPNTISVPQSRAANVDKSKLNGATLRVY